MRGFTFLTTLMIFTVLLGWAPAQAGRTPKAGAGPAEPQPPAQSLKAVLAERVGAGLPVAVFSGEGGLVAISADGQRTMSLVDGAIQWGLVDSCADVIWYGKRGSARELWALDLAAPPGSHVQIATGLPDEPAVGIQHLRGRDPNNRLTRRAARYDDELILTLGGKAPRFEFIAGLRSSIEDVPEQEIRAWIRAIRFTPQGKNFLQKLGGRKTGRTANLASTPPAVERLRTIPTEPCEEEPDMCGTVEGVPGTRYWRVVVGYSCGDGCYSEYQFYDPVSSEFVDLASAGGRSIRPLSGVAPIEEMWISADGQWFLRDDAIHRFEQKASKSGLGTPAGWLGGQWHLF